jgi:CBS domain containing-hemolysin-like protein
MTLLVIYVLLAIAISFLCSILEAVLLSVTPTYVATIQRAQPNVAQKLQHLKDDIDRPLAAILSLNTIAHTVGAAGAGAQAAFVFGDASVAIFSAILTFLILVLSEIIPKTLGAMYWKRFAPMVPRLLPVLIWSMWPLVKMSQFITRLLSRGEGKYVVTREEIVALADIGHREGIIDKGDSRIVANLLRFDRLTVENIMTPRTVMFALQQDMTIEDTVARKDDLRFTRIPIFERSIDEVTGFVLKTDLLFEVLAGGGDRKLAELKRDLTTVPETMLLDALFDTLLKNDRHIALVTDAYGGTAGVVTIEDVVETLLGEEIVDEADKIEDLQAYARQKWQERAAARQIQIKA